MNESTSGRSVRTWNIYTQKNGSGPGSGSGSGSSLGSGSGSWGSTSTSMNAISFGVVATAILISMFLIMAIFEHLFRPENSSFDSPHPIRHNRNRDGSDQLTKLAHQASLVTVTTADVSVVMPGEKLASHIALPAPFPCRREGISWPPHF